jgi:NTP pyrophosphatase (non-canonical NTP hydrolase)
MKYMQDKGISGLVSDLSTSVRSFHDRFEIPKKSSREQLLTRIPIQDEEVRELKQAILYESMERIAEEATDVLYVAIGTLQCIDLHLVSQAIKNVIEKNDSKTVETHHINTDGKVVRK